MASGTMILEDPRCPNSSVHRSPVLIHEAEERRVSCCCQNLLFSTQTCQNSHATHMRMQQDSPHGFQRARPFCNNNRQACHLPRAYCAKRVLGYSSLSSSSLNSFIVEWRDLSKLFCVTTTELKLSDSIVLLQGWMSGGRLLLGWAGFSCTKKRKTRK